MSYQERAFERSLLNVDVPDALASDTYHLYVENKSGVSAPFFVGRLGPEQKLSLTVTTPNGGEVYRSGDRITYGWDQNYENVFPEFQKLDVRLGNFDTGIEYYTAPISGSVGNNIESISGEATTAPAGHYRITICDENTPNPEVTFKPLCDTSDSYFTITN